MPLTYFEVATALAFLAMAEAGVEIAFVLSLVYREEGATEAFAAQGIDFRAIYRASEFLDR